MRRPFGLNDSMTIVPDSLVRRVCGSSAERASAGNGRREDASGEAIFWTSLDRNVASATHGVVSVIEVGKSMISDPHLSGRSASIPVTIVP